MPAPAFQVPAFQVRTAHGTLLRADEDGRLCHAPGPSTLHLHLVASLPGIVVLDAGRTLRLRGLPHPVRLLALRLEPAAPTSPPAPDAASDAAAFPAGASAVPVTLTAPAGRPLLCAEPDGSAALDRHGAGPWEVFTLLPLPGLPAPPALAALPALLAHPEALADRLEGALPLVLPGTGPSPAPPDPADPPPGDPAALPPGLADLLAALLSPAAAARLAGSLLWRPAARAALQGAEPDAAPWDEALPLLAAFLAGRDRPPLPRALTARHDPLAAQDAGPRCLQQRLASAARAAVSPRHHLCLLAAARDEGPYLVEWLAHHRCLGAEHAFLYGNGNDDGSDALLAALHAAGVLTWLRNEGPSTESPQYRAYGHALGLLPEVLDYRWAAILDCDEFVGLDPALHPDIPHFLEWQERQGPVDAVALCWVVHGSGGAVRPDGRPVTRRFPLAGAVNRHVKSLVRPHRFLSSQAHYPIAPAGEARIHRDEAGGAHPSSPLDNAAAFSPAPGARRAWIAHHVWKSAEEYVWRRSHNTGDQPARAGSALSLDHGRLIGFLEQHAGAEMQADERIAHAAPGLEAEMARLRALPGVVAAEAGCLAAYRVRCDALLAQMRASPAFAVPGSPEAVMLRVLEGGG